METNLPTDTVLAPVPPVDGPPIPPQFKLHVSRIKVGERMRKDYGSVEDQQDLADSIAEFGCMHPPSVDSDGNLIAGGRRFHVMTTILKWEYIPVVLGETNGSMARLRMMELEENVRRKEMNWKEKLMSVLEVHRLHKKESALAGEKWTKKMTGELLGISEGNVDYSIHVGTILAKEPNHPIQKCESLNDALKTLLELKEQEVLKHESVLAQEIKASGGFAKPGATLSIDSLIQSQTAPSVIDGKQSAEVDNLLSDLGITNESRTEEDAPPSVGGGQPTEVTPPGPDTRQKLPIEVSKFFWLGDSFGMNGSEPLMNRIADGSIDHILTDLPYGIPMEMLQQSSTELMDVGEIAETHDVDGNIELFKRFFPQAFRVLKDNAFCVTWCDLDHFELLKDLGEAAGFKYCRWPLHWVKTHRCKNQAAQYNFTKAVEHAMVFRKGNATLVAPQGTNFWIGSNEAVTKEFDHPFAKPKELWKWVASAIAPKGSILLDPCMGCGSGPIAFAEAGYYPRGIEVVETVYNKGIGKFKELMTKWFHDKDVIFI